MHFNYRSSIIFLHSKTGFQHMSELVHQGLCFFELGTSENVATVRETQDFYELIYKRVSNKRATMMLSGNTKEGFRMKGSDMDYMYWRNDHRVIWYSSQSAFYNSSVRIMFLADSSECPPGFSLLKLFTPITNSRSVLNLAIVRINDSLYLSSSKFKEINLLAFNLYRNQTFTLHGPRVVVY